MHAAIAQALRHRLVIEDPTFDRVFPAAMRFRSWLHWTPVEVALRAAALLAPGPRHKVLDVGCGVGKLCLVGAATSQASWFGIDRDLEMIRAAKTAATRLHVEHRTHFMCAEITSLDWSSFDSFYFFNPFAEILGAGPGDALARRQRYVATIEFVQQQLARAGRGTRVVTYYGIGGDMPRSYRLVHHERARENELCLWIKR